MKNLLFFGLILSAVLLFQCQSKTVPQSSNQIDVFSFGEDSTIGFLDSSQASQAIVTDNIDHFFDRITLTEMGIQLKTENIPGNREDAVKEYKSFLSSDVSNFTSEEIKTIKEVFVDIKNLLSNINPDLLNQDVQLIKTKGNHYGDGVFYTRENKIVIPENELQKFDRTSFTDVMLHEYFHVFSRMHVETRNELYALIGFQEINGIIALPEQLMQRKLLNPDGTTDYLIKLLTNEGKEVHAYPLLSANRGNFSKDHPSFFEYLDFQLYELIPSEDNVYHLKVDEKGKSTIPFETIPSFFQKIKDNTNYIIHPDEIMADNFIYTIYYLSTSQKKKNFSEEGVELIESFGKVLIEFKS